MKLRHKKTLINGRVEIVMSITNLSVLELKAIKAIGLPHLVFSKTYSVSGFTANINKPINEFIQQKFVFQGDVSNIYDVCQEAEYFIEDIKEAACEIVGELVGEYERLAEMKNDREAEEDLSPKEEYPDKDEEEDPAPEKPPKIDEDSSNAGCSDDCDCGIQIGENIPAGVKDNKIFGIIEPDEDETQNILDKQ